MKITKNNWHVAHEIEESLNNKDDSKHIVWSDWICK